MELVLLVVMILLYILAGVNHFVHPGSYLKIMPPWLPFHEFLVGLTGVLEILFALLLVLPRTRPIGAWCMIILLLAIFPANIQMTINYARGHNRYRWITILRLPLQILLIYWAYRYTGSS
jgi:uncharacterized membrane protein